jgi:NAD(P)-dependent dehydrogenase (short-subunit alcohol dehydrogenase family)
MSATSNFQDRVVLVTGGARNIGGGISEAFLQAGAHVLVCGRTKPVTLPAHDKRKAEFFKADVREYEQCEAYVAEAVKRWGRVDVLINNAGGSPLALAADVSPRFSDKIIRLNLLAPLFCAQSANAVMQEQDSGGAIVNIASVSAVRPSPGTAAYGAAKAGLLNLSNSLAIEWAPKVRVNTVIVGLVKTDQAHLHYGDEAGIMATEAAIPMLRMGVPRDVAKACLFLCSQDASWITGAALPVHGGGEPLPPPAYLDLAKNTAGTGNS